MVSPCSHVRHFCLGGCSLALLALSPWKAGPRSYSALGLGHSRVHRAEGPPRLVSGTLGWSFPDLLIIWRNNSSACAWTVHWLMARGSGASPGPWLTALEWTLSQQGDGGGVAVGHNSRGEAEAQN